jgi:hypothetical protein
MIDTTAEQKAAGDDLRTGGVLSGRGLGCVQSQRAVKFGLGAFQFGAVAQPSIGVRSPERRIGQR